MIISEGGKLVQIEAVRAYLNNGLGASENAGGDIRMYVNLDHNPVDTDAIPDAHDSYHLRPASCNSIHLQPTYS
jgi:hypothetical protein